MRVLNLLSIILAGFAFLSLFTIPKRYAEMKPQVDGEIAKGIALYKTKGDNSLPFIARDLLAREESYTAVYRFFFIHYLLLAVPLFAAVILWCLSLQLQVRNLVNQLQRNNTGIQPPSLPPAR